MMDRKPILAFFLAFGACALCVAGLGMLAQRLPGRPAHAAETHGAALPGTLPFEPIAVGATPLVLPESLAGQDMIGQLRFRGGFHLTSSDPRFGGLSGLEIDEAGVVTAISDRGFWFRAHIDRDPSGAVSGLSDWGVGFIRDAQGAPLESLARVDAEGLTRLDTGLYAVSFERDHRLAFYDLDRFGPAAPAQGGLDVPGIARLGENRGLEALASAGPDLVALAEQAGPLAHGWYLEGESKEWKGWNLSKGVIEAPTALDAVPGDARDQSQGEASPGFVGILRTFAPVIGAEARVIFLPASSFHADHSGEAIRPMTLGVVRAPWPVDNFEAIAAIRAPQPVPLPAGSTARLPEAGHAVEIFILSDNNFSRRQRTLLLVFDWIPPPYPSVADGGEK